MPRKYSDDEPRHRKTSVHKLKPIKTNDQRHTTIVHTQVFNEKHNNYLTNKLLEYTNEMETQPRLFKKGKENAVEMRSMNNK